jgi:hypothetical protein
MNRLENVCIVQQFWCGVSLSVVLKAIELTQNVLDIEYMFHFSLQLPFQPVFSQLNISWVMIYSQDTHRNMQCVLMLTDFNKNRNVLANSIITPQFWVWLKYDLFGGAINRNNVFNCFYFLILFLYTTTCFSPYGPSSGGIYTVTCRSYYTYNGSVFKLYNLYVYVALWYSLKTNLL